MDRHVLFLKLKHTDFFSVFRSLAIGLIVFLCTMPFVKSQVVINEITPDPGNYDGQGAEWTELYNAGPLAADVGCWLLTDGEEIVLIPAGTTIPAGGYLLIYNSNFFNCPSCNWLPGIIANLPANVVSLDLAACGCTNQASCFAVTWENSGAGGNPNNAEGERVVLFDRNAQIVDAIYYGSGARVNGGALVPEAQYADGPLTAGVEITGGGTTGCTLPASNNYDIPAVPLLPATSDAVYEYTGQNPVGCTSSISRSSDGSAVWRLDAWPSPGQTNALADYTMQYAVSGGPLTDLTNTDFVAINVCSGATLTFGADIYGFNQVYNDNDGDNTEGNLEGGSVRGGSNIDATGSLVLTDVPWLETANITTGVTNLQYTTAAITGNTTIKLYIKENTQSVQQPAPGAPYGPGACPGVSQISGSGAGAECYIEKTVSVNVVQPVTSISYACVNGLVTVTTAPSANFGAYTLVLDNSVNNALDRTFTVTTSPFVFQVSQGNAADYILTATGTQNPVCGPLPAVTGGPICVFAPVCATFQGSAGCPVNPSTPCPGDVLSFGLDPATSLNLPEGGRIEWVNDTDNDGDVYDENASAIVGTQTVTVVTVPPVYKNCGNLVAGDIAITNIQSDAPDEFTFVPLVNIAAGTTIYFTDVGVSAGNWYSATGEGGHIGWTAPAGGVTAGTQISISVNGALTSGSTVGIGLTAGTGTLSYYEAPVSNDFALAADGDQVLAYCGTAGTYPTSFLAGITTYALNLWQFTSAQGANSSDLPTGLTNNATAVAIGKSATNGDEWDNAVFSCSGGTLSGSYSAVLATINNSVNWTGSDNRQTAPTCTISVAGSGGSATLALVPSCVSYTVPTTACNTILRIKPRLMPDQTGCTPGSPTPTLPTAVFTVTCPQATLSGEAAICSGNTAQMPIFLANVPTGCTNLSGNYALNGGAPVAFGPLPISDDMATLSGLGTPGIITLTHVSFSGGGCTSCPASVTGSFTLTVANNPANPVPTDVAVCSGQPSAISANGAPDLIWYSDMAGTMVIGGGNSMIINQTGPLTVYVQSVNPDNACRSAIVAVPLVFNMPPVATADDKQACIAYPLDLSGTGTPVAPAVVAHYIWSTGSSNGFTSALEDPQVTNSAVPADAGTYTLYVEDSKGCYDTDEATVTVNPLPVVTLNDPADVCIDGSDMNFTGTPAGGTFSTTAGAGFTANNAAGTAVLDVSAAGAGTYDVTYSYTDGNGCPASRTVSVTVNALPAVTLNDPADVCIDGADMNFTATPVGGVFSTTAGAGFTANNAAGLAVLDVSVAGAGTYNVTYTYTDGNGCPASRTVSVTVAAIPTLSHAGLDQTACVSAANVVLTGNSPLVGTGTWSVVSGPNTVLSQFSNPALPNSIFTPAGGPGVYTLRWTISNAPCAASTDDVQITFNAVPAGTNAGADQSGCPFNPYQLGGAAPAVGTASWSVVAGPNLSATQFSSTTSPTAVFTPAAPGVYTLRWTIANPPCTNAQDDVVITAVDAVLPSINCPAGTTRTTDAGLCSAMVTYSVPTFSDNCPVPAPVLTRLSGLASGSAFPLGTTPVTWQVRDASGNTASCTFTVTVEDREAPKINCPGNLTFHATAGMCGLITDYALPMASDNCGTVGVMRIAGLATGSFFPAGNHTLTYEAQDGALPPNVAQCSFTITIADTQLPSIACPTNYSVVTDPTACVASVTYPKPTASDNCPLSAGQPVWVSGGTGTTVAATTATATFGAGINQVVWKVTDGAGNMKTCSFRVVVTDNQAPLFVNCPAAPVVLNTTAGACTATAAYTAPTATDNCTVNPMVTRISGPAPGTLLAPGTHLVVFRATDAAGRSATCQLTLQVKDNQAPAITCPADIVANAAPNLCCVAVFYALPVPVDNCPGSSVLLQSGLASGSLFFTGTQAVVLRATDAGGNTATCSFTVTIVDAQSPVLTCPPNTTVSGGGVGCTYASNLLPLPVVQENCELVSLTNNAPAQLSVGPTSVVWTGIDGAGLAATCQYSVTVWNCASRPGREEAEYRGGRENKATDLQILPNPASTFVEFIWSGVSSATGHLLLYDATGRLVWQGAVADVSGVQHVDVGASGLTNGLYYLKLQTADGMVSRTFVVAE